MAITANNIVGVADLFDARRHQHDKVLGAVRVVVHSELSDDHDYVLALHTDTPRPHVHVTVQAKALDRTRFSPRPVQLNRFRERFARELRARGVAAEATPRRARRQHGGIFAIVLCPARKIPPLKKVALIGNPRDNGEIKRKYARWLRPN